MDGAGRVDDGVRVRRGTELAAACGMAVVDDRAQRISVASNRLAEDAGELAVGSHGAQQLECLGQDRVIMSVGVAEVTVIDEQAAWGCRATR